MKYTAPASAMAPMFSKGMPMARSSMSKPLGLSSPLKLPTAREKP
jgi:hypothetical protein